MSKAEHPAAPELNSDVVWKLIESRLTSDVVWKVVEPRITSDGIWKLIQPRVEEYWSIAKKGAWLVGGVVLLMGGVIGTIVGFQGGPQKLINSIIKFEQQLNDYFVRAEAKEILKKAARDYVAGEEAKKILKDAAHDYFTSEDAAKAFEMTEKLPVRVRGEELLKNRFAENWRTGIKNVVVAHSFSVSFELSDLNKTYKFKLKRPDGSAANIDCDGVWPAKGRNQIYIKANDFGLRSLTPDQGVYIGRANVDLAKANSVYPSETSRRSDPDSLSISFVVDDSMPFTGTINVQCTATVAAPAQLTQ